MATIVTRSGKGSPLTNNEVDANFTNLNTDKIESGDTVASLTITSADINGGDIASAVTINKSPQLTLTGDVTGTVTFTNLANGSMTTTASADLLRVDGDGSDLLNVRAETVEVTVKNVSGGSLAKGTPVHQTGTSGSSTFEVVAANASNSALMPAHFVLLETLADQAEGRGLLMGRISGVDTSSFSAGDTIYVAAGGGYTNVAPTGEGNLIQNLGTVTRVDATNGGGEVMGAGRSNATPNLNSGNIFLGNASNQAVSASLSTSVSNLAHYNNTNWDTAYSWGNHASAGYLTSYTETDPVFSASAAAGITATNITNWNTAYGWGDHASAGYLTGNQTITLSGDASGSGTTSILVTVADDSHNHIISNVDGLQTALDGKLGATAAAVSADKWTTARTVSLTGAVTGSASVDGSANVSIATTHTADPTITLTGAVTGSGTMTNLGNVSIATTATADPTLTLAGDASGSATFTNLGNATLTVTVADDSHNHVISNVDGLQTALDGKLSTTGGTVSGDLTLTGSFLWQVSAADTARQRADARDDATNFSRLHWYGLSDTGATSNFRHAWYDGAGYINVTANSSGRIDFTGTAASMYIGSDRVFDDGYHPNADKWTTARTLSLTGAVTGSASIDGSGNVSLATTATSDPTLTLSGDATGSATFTNLGNATLSVTVVDDSHNHAFNNLTSKTGGTGTYYTSGIMAGATLQAGTSSALTSPGQLGLFGNSPYISFHPADSVSRNGYLQKVNSGDYFLFGEEAYVRSETSFRAPIFYDTDNTGYYTNPAGTSVMNNIYLEGEIYHNGDTNTYIQFHAADQFRVVTGGAERLEVNSSYILVSHQVRAPIFYDSNNTAYYFDGSSTGDSIRVAGDIVAYYSDERLKTNLGNIESPVDKVKQLNGFKYHANELGAKHGYDPEKIQVGVSAQEVEAVLPEVVRDAPIGHGYKTVQYERLVPLLIEAIKEQAGQIEALQAEIAALKS